MGLVAVDGEVRERALVERGDAVSDAERRERAWRSHQLFAKGLDVVEVDMSVADDMDELARLRGRRQVKQRAKRA